MNKSDVNKIILYLTECYGCDRTGKYKNLYNFVLSNGVALSNFSVRRVVLYRSWKRESEKYKLPYPFVVLLNENDEELHACTVSEFDELFADKPKAKKSKAKAKKTVVKEDNGDQDQA